MEVLQLQGTIVDLRSGELCRLGRVDCLTELQLDLLRCFVAHSGHTLSRDELLERVWRGGRSSRVVDTAVRGLRSRIERDPATPEHLLTVHGSGYRFLPAVDFEGEFGQATRWSSFVGRGAQLLRLGAAFAEGTRCLCLSGPPGVGKTRLAMRFVATRAVHGMTGEAVVVELAEARDAAAFDRLVASALSLSLGGAEQNVDRVGRALASWGNCLVVLDNLEQVSDLASERVARWSALAPEAQWLLTSQRALDLPGQTLVQLDALVPEDAVLLFIQRARAAGAGTDGLDRAVVDQICARVDRLPLALELAASRVPTLGLPELGLRLASSFQLLSGGAWQGEIRHETLEAAINWSWSLLGPDEQRALARCSVFRGCFLEESGAAVLGSEEPGLKPSGRASAQTTLSSLTEASLIAARIPVKGDSSRRFQLSPAIQDFASRKLDDRGGGAEVLELHAAWFLTLARRLGDEVGGAGEPGALRALTADLADFLQAHEVLLDTEPDGALELALALERALAIQGTIELRAQLLERSIEVVSRDRATPRLARGLGALGLVRLDRGDPTGSLAALDQAAEMARALADDATTSYVFGRHGIVRLRMGDSTLAEEALDEACRAARRSNLWSLEAEAAVCQGILLENQGRLREAMVRLEEALALGKRAGNIRVEAAALANQGIVAERLGDRIGSRKHRSRAFGIYESLESAWHKWTARVNQAVDHLNAGEVDEAAALFTASAQGYRRLGASGGEAIVIGNLGLVELVRGRQGESERLLLQAKELHQQMAYRRHEGFVATSLGVHRQMAGRLDEAREELLLSLDCFGSDGDEQGRSLSEALLAVVELERGEAARAVELADAAWQRQDQVGDHRLEEAVRTLRELVVAEARPVGARLAVGVGQPSESAASVYEWLASSVVVAFCARR